LALWVVVIAASVGLAVYVLTRDDLSDADATREWKTQYESDWQLWWPRDWRVVRGARTGHNDLSYWFLLELPPPEVDQFKQAIAAKSRHGSYWTADDLERRDMSVSLENPPKWWKPESLPDADSLVVGFYARHYRFIFSHSTGRVYVYRHKY
jgi:hypothetical protein